MMLLGKLKKPLTDDHCNKLKDALKERPVTSQAS
jgi:hypothetical protein